MSEIKITKNNFESEVLQSDIPVLVDFWAQWCGPCKMIAPVVSEIATEYEGKIKVGKIDVDEEAELAIKFGVSSIPAILVFKDGKVTNTSVGYVTKDKLIALFE